MGVAGAVPLGVSFLAGFFYLALFEGGVEGGRQSRHLKNYERQGKKRELGDDGASLHTL